jgi:hypothetical protein
MQTSAVSLLAFCIATCSKDLGEAKLVSSESDELVPLFIPALVVLLTHLEDKKGAALTEVEALELRDKATCVMVPKSTLPAMIASRGYEDIDPERCWEQWQVARQQLLQSRTGE